MKNLKIILMIMLFAITSGYCQNARQHPIYIIGNEIFEKYIIDKIDSIDIESVNVLKDKAAIDKYGDKAKDGAIIITIKQESIEKYTEIFKKIKKENRKNKKTITVTGIVTDCENEPIAGVNIALKSLDYDIKTISNINGEFSIKASINDILTFDDIDYARQNISIVNNEKLRVKLLKKNLNGLNILDSKNIIIKKPVIYLYPTEETDITVKLHFEGNLLTTFPKYNEQWNVKAYPDGKIFDKNSKRFYASLFWDGQQNFPEKHYQYQSGFIVKKENLTKFLIDSLEKIGLTTSETNEFIQFWLPILEQNDTNFIHFYINDSYNIFANNVIVPKPDTYIKVFMEFCKVNDYTKIPEQILYHTGRKGFTAVEWGGSDVTESTKTIKNKL